jgi:hypothetical protein
VLWREIVIEDKRLVGAKLRKWFTSTIATVLLLTSITAFADFTAGESRTLGVGRIQSTANATVIAPTERLVLSSSETEAPASIAELATPIDRDVAINEPTPVIAPAAVVSSGEAAAGEGAWSSGLASAYGEGFYGRWTARGTQLTEDCMGVAVPASWGYLLGRTIQVEYNGQVITTIIDDTGGFAVYGRVLDLQPGLWRAFGFDSEYDWGVRPVRYRIID